MIVKEGAAEENPLYIERLHIPQMGHKDSVQGVTGHMKLILITK